MMLNKGALKQSCLSYCVLFLVVNLHLSLQICTRCPLECSCSERKLPQAQGRMSNSCEVNCTEQALNRFPQKDALPNFVSWVFMSNNSFTTLMLTTERQRIIEISFSHNLIKSLSSTNLAGLTKLQKLDLSHNQIESIAVGSFQDTAALEEVNFSGNFLKILPDDLLSHPVIITMWLSQNLWMCNCELISLQNWLVRNTTNVPDISNATCTSPQSVQGQNLTNVDLSIARCADSYVSCAWDFDQEERNFIVWEFTDSNETIIYDDNTCVAFCFYHGFYYAVVNANDSSCLCAGKNTARRIFNSNQNEWAQCLTACNQMKPAEACERKGLYASVHRASPELSFVGLRSFSQREEVVLMVQPKIDIVESYIWSFNTTVVVTDQKTVRHKFAHSGNYWVSVTAQCGAGSSTYSLYVVVQEPVGDAILQCNAEVSPGKQPSINITLNHGTNAVVSWSSRHNGIETKDQSFCPTGAVYYTHTKTCYQVYDGARTWQSARDACINIGGDLAVIDSFEIDQFITANVSQTKKYWIGISTTYYTSTNVFVKIQNNFFHVSGTSVLGGYNKWDSNEPDIKLTQVAPKECVSMKTNGKWSTEHCNDVNSYICQFASREKLYEPVHQLAGTVVFESTYPTVVNVSTATVSPVIQVKNVLLFPGMWVFNQGFINSWEIVAKAASSSNENISLQVYRPTCNSTQQLQMPGCTSTPYTSCGNTACAPDVRSCSDGEKFCRLSNTCMSPFTSCNWYNDESNTTPARHMSNLPSYTLVSEYPIHISGTAEKLYQLSVTDSHMVKADDVIGISFYTGIPTTSTLSTIPVVCKNSTLSSWTQSAMLFRNVNSDIIEPDFAHNWFDFIWCDVRMHYTQPSQAISASASFLTQENPGDYMYSAHVHNQVSSSSPSAQSSCVVTVLDEIRELKLVSSLVTKREADKVLVFVRKGENITFAFQVLGGGNNTITNLTAVVLDQDIYVEENKTLDSGCPSGVELTITDCSGVSSSILTFNEVGNSSINVIADNKISSSSIQVKVITQEGITGAEILPTGVNRILAEIPLEFTSNYSTGSNVKTEWIIDEVVANKVVQSNYLVLFRKPGNYQLMMVLSNDVSSENVSISLIVDDMNKLKDLVFVNLPSIVERNVPTIFEVEFLVDENIDVNVTWAFDSTDEGVNKYLQPHTGIKPASSVEQVALQDSYNKTFILFGNVDIRVTVWNAYDTINIVDSFKVKSKLTSLVLSLGNDPAVNEEIEMITTMEPSPYDSTIEFDWGDASGVTSTSKHVYTSPGDYNVTVKADNGISSIKAWKVISVYERITLLTAWSDEPTEFGQTTTVSASVATGDGSLLQITYDFGDGSPLIENQTVWNYTHTYATTGTYTITITVRNPIGEMNTTLKVNVFNMKIVLVNITADCFPTNSLATMEVIMPTDSYELFNYLWDFDGSILLVDKNNTVTHNYTNAMNHTGSVEVQSIRTSATDSKTFSVCVQDEIKSVNILMASQAVATGEDHQFSFSVIGGTDALYSLYLGDGNLQLADVSIGQTYKYSTAGRYNVVLNAQNLVSNVNGTNTAIVQDRITGLTITTNSEYGFDIAFGHNVTYTAVYTGTDVSFKWTFGDLSGEKTGNPVNHVYNSTIDNFEIQVIAENLVDKQSTKQPVKVYRAVFGFSIDPFPEIVEVGTTIIFNLTSYGDPKTFYWKITPGSNTIHEWDSEDTSITRRFDQSGEYTVVLKAENKVSSENETMHLLVADPISSIFISSNDPADHYSTSVATRNYVAVDEVTRMRAVLVDGRDVLSTVYNHGQYVFYKWKITMPSNSTFLDEFTNMSFINYTFTETTVYNVWLNASNTITTQFVEITLDVRHRIGNVMLVKDGHPANAVITGSEMTLVGSVSSGTPVTYTWRAYEGADPKDYTNNIFRHTYTIPGMYKVLVNVENPLEKLSTNFIVYVEDEITGLEVEHLNAIVPFYVPSGTDSLFKANVSTGTGVLYYWQYMNTKTGTKSDIRYTELNTISWNFTGGNDTIYTLSVNASNKVSWKMTETTVYVITPVLDLSVNVSVNGVIQSIISTNDIILVDASVSGGTAVIFSYNFGDNSPIDMGSSIEPLSSKSSHAYSSSGVYNIRVTASNNATKQEYSGLVFIRDPITGLIIDGLTENQFLLIDEVYTMRAVVTSGTNITYSWLITNSDSTSVVHSGEVFTHRFSVLGSTAITLQAGNGINTTSQTISVNILEPPNANVKLLTTGNIYTHQKFSIRVLTTGTDVSLDIDYDDGTTVLQSTNSTYMHTYSMTGTYNITIRAYNKAAEIVKSLILLIGKLACIRPTLSFSARGEPEFYRSRMMYLETQIQTFGCTEYDVQYIWSIHRQPSCENPLDITRIDITAYTPLLTLPALSLEVGSYCVTCTVSYKQTSLSDSQSIMIHMLPTPLVVVISGGTFRFVSESVTLDASSSFDPDLPSTNQTELHYEWKCTSKVANEDLYGLSKNKCGNIIHKLPDDNCFQSRNGSIIQFNNPVTGREYNFTVTAWKLDKDKVSSWQSVTVVQCNIPTVTVTCYSCMMQSSIQISSAHHLVLLGSCDSCSRKDNVEFLWEAVRRNSTDAKPTSFLLNKLSTTTGNTGRYLVVRVGAIKTYYEYEFRLKIKVNGVEGFSKLLLYANKPPVNGVCNINFSGDQVYVLDTLVQFECSGWNDEDVSPLIYTILAIRYNDGVKIDDFVIYKGTLSTYEAYLPIGYKTNEYDVVIEIRVEDELGTYTVGISKVLNVKLSVAAESNTVEWLLNKTNDQLSELKKSSNPQVVADFAAGLITVLNQESDNQGQGTEDAEFQLRKVIRQNITETVISLSTNTLDEIQQVTTVFKQCVQVASEIQDNGLQVASIEKLEQLTSQMPDYVESASQTLFHSVTTNLMGIVSSMVDSANFHVYVTGEASTSSTSDLFNSGSDPTLDPDYRKALVNRLLESAVQLNQNILDGKVEGEEPVFINASALSSVSARTTPATMNSTVMNNGCHMSLPKYIFSNISEDTEILYMFFVAEQNPYTFGYLPSSISPLNKIANISTRVPSLQFSYHNSMNKLEKLEVHDLAGSDSHKVNDLIPDNQLIRMVMAPSDRQFIPTADTNEIATLSNSSIYSPRSGVHFKEEVLQGLESRLVTITNNNTDKNTAVHIMIVFHKITLLSLEEPKPYVDAYFDYEPLPTEEKHNIHLRLTESMVSDQSDHRNYTIYLNPTHLTNTAPKYYLNVSSYFTHHTIKVGVGVYYSSCQYFDNSSQLWSTSGLRTSDQTVPSAAVCLSSHLTSFGSFVISPPNIIDFTDVKDIDFSQNPIALILVIVVFVLYVIGVILARKLDLKDIENASLIPLCGHNGSHKYEITIKTSPGLGSGTSANVGICIYGYESRTGSKHLYKKGAYQRGSVDVFQVATDTSIGTIYKIKIWHDNTGLDPGWYVSRVMVKDLQNGEKYYFLVDSWLQVYPYDDDATCLAKTIRVATEEEMEDFSYLFGNQMSYGWEDSHLWLSLIERPQRSRFTLVQRWTCCITLLYSFMVTSAFWFQNYDGENGLVDEAWFRWSDIAVGTIVSIMILPINLVLVALFKHTKSKVAAIKPWPDRTQTAQTVEILDEILDGRSKRGVSGGIHDFQSGFGSLVTLPGQSEDGAMDSKESQSRRLGGLHKTTGTLKSLDIKDKFWLSNGEETDDTGIGTGASSKGSSPIQFTSDTVKCDIEDRSSPESDEWPTRKAATSEGSLHFQNKDLSDVQNKGNTIPLEDDSDDDDFWDPFLNDEPMEDYSHTGASRTTNLRRTRKAKFTREDDLELEDVEDEEDYDSDDVPLPDMRNQNRRVYLRSRASTTLGLNLYTGDEYLLPYWMAYFTYFLCFATMAVSIFFIILYVNEFGLIVAQRWVFTMFIALLESFFLIEPTKVLILAGYVAMFTKRHVPEEKDNLVEDPLVETYEHVKGDHNKIRPPRGFALTHCKLDARKSHRARKLIVQFFFHGLFLWAVIGFCVWDSDTNSYLSSWSIKSALYQKPIIPFDAKDNETIIFREIRTVHDVWGWMDQVMSPMLFEDTLDNSINQNHLLGIVRIRQQRTVPRVCTIAGNNQLNQLLPSHNCLPPNTWKLDERTYYVGWSTSFTTQNATWIFEQPCFTGIGYWGQEQIYDDSGYSKYIDKNQYKSQLDSMQADGWIDRNTRVCMAEFTMLNPATHWFTVSTVMFEIGLTGAVRPSHITQTLRLFSPGSYFTLDMFFITFIGVIGILFWIYEIVKLTRHKQNILVYFKKPVNWMNNIVNISTLALCCLFIYKEIYMDEIMKRYKSNRSGFTNFYKMAFVHDMVKYTATILLTILIIKCARLMRFIRRWSTFGDTIYTGCQYLIGTTFLLLVLIIGYALFGFLILGLNSPQVVPDFANFQNSLYSMFRALRGQLNTKLFFHVNPAFTVLFFFTFYFGVFIIFCRLFSAIYIQGYKDAKFKLRLAPLDIQDYEMIPYIWQRLKLRLGITKPKQYRPTVRFEGMSTPSSRGSFLSTDSFGTCFTAGRISQCSDATGISASSSDSGLGTPSDHSLSLFDYLTLEHPPYEKPMDSVHLDYLYNRLSSYSVDMMLHRFERFNKLSEDVLSIESTLLAITQKEAQRKLLHQKSSEIAAAAATNSSALSQTTPSSSSRSTTSDMGRESNSRSLYSSLSSNSEKTLVQEQRLSTVVNSIFPPTGDSSSMRRRRTVRSSSYGGDVQLSTSNEKRGTISSANAVLRVDRKDKPTLKRRPHSDEGARVQAQKSKDNLHNSLKLTKKTAW